ncbi:transcriptional regulator, araC family [Vibrio ishigakensis]|uniref:Transcriptional regulator, araC family n=1 Tax=Vibrio ishigakensis TaxID=1481914 RepID=A0A0B8P5Q0_9VIBR|nr:transcriptional regulator, araC family [Vibrio ishigakensis]
MRPFRQNLPDQSQISTITCQKVNLDTPEPYWHYHKQIELLYAYSGRAQRLIGDNRGVFSQGELLLLGEDLPHGFSVGEGVNDCVILVIQFDAQILSVYPEFREMVQLIKSSRFGMSFDKLSSELHQQLKCVETLEPSTQLIALFSILDELIRHPSAQLLSSVEFSKKALQDHRYEKLNRVIAHIHANKAQSLSVDAMAEFSNMTKPAFCRWFKKSMSVSYLTYLNSIRVEDACRLLLHSDLPVSQVALEVGFDSISSFYRNFSNIKSCTPSDYRESLK